MQDNSKEIQEYGVLADLVYEDDYFGLNPLKDSEIGDRPRFNGLESERHRCAGDRHDKQ